MMLIVPFHVSVSSSFLSVLFLFSPLVIVQFRRVFPFHLVHFRIQFLLLLLLNPISKQQHGHLCIHIPFFLFFFLFFLNKTDTCIEKQQKKKNKNKMSFWKCRHQQKLKRIIQRIETHKILSSKGNLIHRLQYVLFDRMMS